MNATTAVLATQILAGVIFLGAIGMAAYLVIANKKDNQVPEALPGAVPTAVKNTPEESTPARPRFSFEQAANAPQGEGANDSLPAPAPSRRALRLGRTKPKKDNHSDTFFAGDTEVDNWG